MFKTTIIAAASLAALSPTVYADAPLQLDNVIVTATRTAVTAEDSLAAVTVITRQDIEQQQAHSLQDLLRGTPGLSVTNNGGAGKSSSLFLRGTNSDHVLVLVDGVKVGSATLGSAAFQDLPIEQIDRIEIVRGPRSSLYGSEAIGGVVQIFTRKGEGPIKPFFSLSTGRYNTTSAAAGIAGGHDNYWFNISASGSDTDGFNTCDASFVAGCFADEPDRDGYTNIAGNLRAGYRFRNNTEIDIHWLRTEAENEFDGGFVNEGETVQDVKGIKASFTPSDFWQFSVQLGRNHDESDNFKDGVFMTRFDTQRDSVTWQNDFVINDTSLLTLGLDYQRDTVDGTTDYEEDSRDNKGAFAQLLTSIENHDLQFSMRNDDNQNFGDSFTGSLGWGYTLRNDVRLTANHGTAFKAPTFNELYFPGFGNPELDSETSQSLELGISGPWTNGHWSAHYFHTEVDDIIVFDANTFAPANLDKARIDGLEFVLGWRFWGWDIDTSITRLHHENRSSGFNDGNQLPRRAEQTLRLDVDRGFGNTQLGATLFGEGRRYDDIANSRELAGYATVDLRAEVQLAKAWRLQGRIENLFDKDYETAAFFNQPGRGAYVTLRYAP